MAVFWTIQQVDAHYTKFTAGKNYAPWEAPKGYKYDENYGSHVAHVGHGVNTVLFASDAFKLHLEAVKWYCNIGQCFK